MPPSVSVKVWGDFALFTRPELKVERLSYPIMTPSAARGVLDAILFKPQMAWHVRRITALKPVFPPGFPEAAAKEPFRFIQIRRNEIKGTIGARAVNGWLKDTETFQPYLVDQMEDKKGGIKGHRTQRNSLILNHVAYRIDASPKLTKKANKLREKPEEDEDHGPDTVVKYVAMFNRRVEKGQCFHRPYLGCREFACQFAPPSGADEVLVGWTESLGLMLYDIQFREVRPNVFASDRPGFFMANVKNGVLHCDTDARGPHDEPLVKILGWDTEGGAE